MRITIQIGLILIIALIFSCGPSPKEAGKYNDNLSAYHNQVVYQLDVLEESFKSFDTLIIRKELDKTKEITALNFKKLLEKGDLKGDSSLFKADSTYYRICFDILNTEYEKMFYLYALPDEKYGKDGESSFKNLQAEKDRKFTEAYEHFFDVQEEFRQRYNLKATKNIK